MNKKLIVTIACLMSVHGASAAWTDYLPTWQSVQNVFTGNRQQASVFERWFVSPIANNIIKPIQTKVNSVVATGQRAAVYSSAPRYAYNFMSTNPYSATGVGFAAGSYPRLILPLLGAGAAAYTLKRQQDFNPVDEQNFSQNEKNSAQRKRIAKRIFAGLGGAFGTFAFMKKPKLMMVAAILTGLAYKFKVGPFANKVASTEDGQEDATDHDHDEIPNGVVCNNGVCTLPDNS